jgi:hypothetical protein
MPNSLTVKRQITVKTIVTEDFKQKAADELVNEIKLIDEQINHLQLQVNQIIQQFQQQSPSGFSIPPQEADQIMNELNLRLQQLVNLKQNLNLQIDNIKHTKAGDTIITGSLENYVELKTGDNLYNVLLDKEIVVKDGEIQEIKV